MSQDENHHSECTANVYIICLCLAFSSAELLERERERESELGVADLRQLERLVEVFEKSLVKLRKELGIVDIWIYLV